MNLQEFITKEIALALGSGGGVGALIVGYLRLKVYRAAKKEKQSTREEILIDSFTVQNETNNQLFTQILITLQGMDHTLSLGFKNKVKDSHQEIMELKKLAHNKQQDDLYNGLKRIIRANDLPDKRARLEDIRDLLTTAIRDTDDTLYKFNLCGYIAPTDAKILHVCNSDAPEILYRIINNKTNQENHQKLEDNIRKYARIILNDVKANFYDADGKVKQ